MRMLLALLVLTAPTTASAGPATYAWLPATEVMASEEVELGGSVAERNDLGGAHERSTGLGWAPAFGATDQLELRLPFELTSRSQLGEQRNLALTRFGLEVRYRFTPRTSPLAPIVRAALARDVAIRTLVRAELEAAVSYEHGRFHAAAAAALISEMAAAGHHEEVHPGAGAAVRVWRALRLGAELHAEWSRDSVATSWAAAGPTISWRTGASWLTATYAFGLSAIDSAPRLAWGLAW